MGSVDDDASCGGATAVPLPQPPRKAYWRSVSWSASRTPPDFSNTTTITDASDKPRRCPPVPPLTPRSKARPCLPPLQPLSITRRSVDEWPLAGSDDVGEWPAHPPTPRAAAGDGLKIDLTSLRSVGRRDQLAMFDKECSKVAEHIYLGGDAVARNREILRQNGITHVLNCVGFVCPEYFKSDLVYKTLWLQDSPTEDITSILYDVFDYFEDVREQGGRVLVHCCQGVSRSTSLVIAYLMWREERSFDDAFQFVKAARGIANPNVGFACQLLQCQKRVHAIPLSPNSVLRMYRMAPHSPYDALHLVPKVLNNPSPNMLDSRGAFILHVSSIYVWIGKSCWPAMEKDAKSAALQVVRYERVQGPILFVEEGEEPAEFWEAFANGPNGLEKTRKEDADFAAKTCAGKRKVDAYDADFELFYKAISGGVVPPFSSSGGPGQETHIPARESNWSVLRRKFISGALSRIYSDSVLSRDGDPRPNRIRLLSADTSTSPPYLSPNSLSCDSSSRSKSSSDSPSLSSSSTCSPLTPSAVSSNLTDCLPPSSKPSFCLSSSLEPLKSCSEEVTSPSKGLTRSIAERRGSFSLLKLPTLTKASTLRRTEIELFHDHGIPAEDLDRSDGKIVNTDLLHRASGEGCAREFSRVVESAVHSSRNCTEPQTNIPLKDRQVSSASAEFFDRNSKTLHLKEAIVYQWPENEILTNFATEDLNSREVFFILTSNTERAQRGGEIGRTLYIWVGSNFEHANLRNQPCHDSNAGQASKIDWSLIGHDFLASKGLAVDIPINVIMNQESLEFDELLKSM